MNKMIDILSKIPEHYYVEHDVTKKWSDTFMEYEKEIDRMVDILLEQEDHHTLRTILRNYDMLVKEQANKEGNTNINLELPYWCYCWCQGEK